MAAVSVNSVPRHPLLLKPAELVFHSRVCGQLRREAAKQPNTSFATERTDDQVQCDRQAQQPVTRMHSQGTLKCLHIPSIRVAARLTLRGVAYSLLAPVQQKFM